MLVGERLGPILVEKEIGAGAMGTVYRGTIESSGQRVAIKMMSPAIASNESSAARFEREANILKQLRHPNIVRLFGVGKHKGLRYYAMEYIKGESLDHLLARQGKLSWDEVISLGTQLCAALQHAHDKGVVHRDLKPSNLMILRDGTLKLTDFGIAKDLDVTQLTEANCTVGTAAYMSPEQCRGDRNLTYKSDLYSLGVVFFELITGKKPFYAETAMEMFLCHVEKTPARVCQIELDVPIWMDNLVNQLMEKNPDHRPLNAQIVSDALAEVQEKVETQQSAGIEAVTKRRVDRGKNDPKLDEKDKEAARALRGKKKRKKQKSKPSVPIWVWQVLGIVAVIGGMATVLYFAFRPTDPDELYQQAKALMESKNPDDWFEAQSGPIAEYMESYRDRPGQQTDDIFRWSEWIEMYEADRKVDNYVAKRRDKNITIPSQNDAEELAFKAGWAEVELDFGDAVKYWTELQEKFSSAGGLSRWGELGKHRLGLIDKVKKQDAEWAKLLTTMRKTNREPELGEFEELAFRAARAELLGDKFWARELYVDLQKAVEEDLDTKPHMRHWLLLALWNLEDLKKVEDIDRKAFLDKLLEEQQTTFDPMTCLAIVAVYKGEPKYEAEVERAKALLKQRGVQVSLGPAWSASSSLASAGWIFS